MEPPPGQASPTQDPPPTDGVPTASEAPAPTVGPAPTVEEARPQKKKKGTLRERVAQDREIQRLKRRELLILRLPLVVLALLVPVLAVYAARRPLLRSLARSDTSAREWAVGHLAEARDPYSFDIYVEQLGRDHDTQTFNELVFLGGGRYSIPMSGDDPGPEVPEAVAEHKAVLLADLKGDRAELRRGALYALWTLQGRSWTRETAVLKEVGALLDPPCEDPVARRYAALVLKASPAPEEVHAALLRAALQDEDRLVRRNAVEAVGNTLNARLGPGLLPALEDEFPEIRREASLALARLDADVSLASLERIYRSDQPAMQAEVLEVIAARPGEEVVPILLDGLSAQAPATRRAAVLGLAKRPGVSVRRGLETALSDRVPFVRLAAIEVLVEREDGALAVPSLVDALRRHEGWQEISALHGALKSLTGADVPAPTPLKESWQPSIEGWDAYLERGAR